MNIDGEELLNRGMQAAREGRWDEARSVFFDVVAQDPSNFEVWLWLGAIAEDPKDAVAYLEQALLINPKSIRAQKGMEWAEERLASAGVSAGTEAVEEAASETTAAPTEPISEGLPAAEASPPVPEPPTSAAISVEDSFRGSPVYPETDSQAESDVAATPSGIERTAAVPVIPEAQWKEERAFSDEDLSSTEIDEDETPSSLPISEAQTASLDELPLSAIPDLQAEEAPEPEESPLILPPLDAGPTQPAAEAASIPVEEPVSSVQEPISEASSDLKEAPTSTESWEAIIGRLRTLDDQLQGEEKEAPSREALGDAVTSDAAPATDSFSLPPSAWTAPPADQIPATAQLESQPTAAVPRSPEPQPVLVAGDESADELTNRGRQYLEAGQVDEAIQSFKLALELEPEHVEANEQLGVAEYQAGHLEESIAAFETVVRLKPEQAEAHANLGFLYAEQGRADQAIASFRNALEHDSGLVEAYINIGDLYKSQGKIDEAVEALNAAARLKPDLPDVHFSLGEVYAERGQIGEAIWEFRLVVDYKPDEARAHLKLGQLLFQAGRFDDASREFREALQFDQSLAEAHYGLASCLERQGHWNEAIAELERSLAIKPDYLEADEKLMRLREAVASQQENKDEEGQEDKKKGWFIFKREKK